MKNLLPFIKAVIAVVIIIFLFNQINNRTQQYDFTISNSEASVFTTYTYNNATFIPYALNDNTFTTFCYESDVKLPATGYLNPTDTQLQPVHWKNFSVKKNGIKALKLSILKSYKNKSMFFLSIGLFAICLFCIILRWKIILEGFKIAISTSEIIKIFFIGQFFNFFMIGATGGDIVKALYITGKTSKKAESASSVFIDRFIGLFGQISMTSIILMINFNFYMKFETTKYITIFILLAFAAFICIILSIIFMKPVIDCLINKLPGKHKILATADTVYEGIRFCLTNKSIAIKTLSLSYINHITAIIMMFAAGEALGVEIRWQAYFLITPIINTIGSIPITPGGLGMREMASVTLFGLLGVNISSAFFLSFITYFAGMLWSVPGAIIYLKQDKF